MDAHSWFKYHVPPSWRPFLGDLSSRRGTWILRITPSFFLSLNIEHNILGLSEKKPGWGNLIPWGGKLCAPPTSASRTNALLYSKTHTLETLLHIPHIIYMPLYIYIYTAYTLHTHYTYKHAVYAPHNPITTYTTHVHHYTHCISTTHITCTTI